MQKVFGKRKLDYILLLIIVLIKLFIDVDENKIILQNRNKGMIKNEKK